MPERLRHGALHLSEATDSPSHSAGVLLQQKLFLDLICCRVGCTLCVSISGGGGAYGFFLLFLHHCQLSLYSLLFLLLLFFVCSCCHLVGFHLAEAAAEVPADAPAAANTDIDIVCPESRDKRERILSRIENQESSAADVNSSELDKLEKARE